MQEDLILRAPIQSLRSLPYDYEEIDNHFDFLRFLNDENDYDYHSSSGSYLESVDFEIQAYELGSNGSNNGLIHNSINSNPEYLRRERQSMR